MIEQTYFSHKVEKRRSDISGRGLFAREPITPGEIITVKGGFILNRQQRDEIGRLLGPSEIQISEDLYIGPTNREQREGGMLHMNHSCDPNVGLQGQIVFVALRGIALNEEITCDYAMTDDEAYEMQCLCKTSQCRGLVTGYDWQRPELQVRYDGYFSWYIQRRIDAMRKK